MEIDNNNNQDSDSDDPTVELKPLSEAACNMLQAEDATALPDAAAATEESHERCFETGAPVSADPASEIQALRDELRSCVDMNSSLRDGNDRLRERCDRLAEQAASLLKANETLSNELERSRRQAMSTEHRLTETRHAEQAPLTNMKRLNKEDAAERTSPTAERMASSRDAASR